ncbi:MAG: phosphopantothenoylcysteine decarboxylase [Candidatus Omnitrophota bacterium]
MAFKASAPHILITSGPTAVPMDGMRIISNLSTGEMGRLLANAFALRKYRVTLLEGCGATTDIPLSEKVDHKEFFFYAELDLLLKKELCQPCDALIHAAAVSDFALSKPFNGKIPSGKPVMLKLVPTKKIVNAIKKMSPDIFLVGFKLETSLVKGSVAPKVSRLIREAGCDLVVANVIRRGRYMARLVDASGRFYPQVDSKQDLVKALTARVDQQFL